MEVPAMQTFRLEQETWKNSNFNVTFNGAPVAQFHAPPMKWEGTFEVEGRKLLLKTKSAFKTSAHIEAENGAKLVEGVSEGIFRNKYTVTAGSESYVVKDTSGVIMGHTVFQGDMPVGQARGESYGASNGTVTLPAPMSLECKLLLMWLFARSWRSSKENSTGDSFNN